MEKKERIYPAKLLLFGEHTVLKGFSSLAIPYNKYFMKWVDKTAHHPEWLTDYVAYLSKNCSEFIEVEKLQEYTRQFTIEANIPIGYGLGSSGALTAAIYDACTFDKPEDLDRLQAQLGKMESYFHGESSGFDPLICFCAQPIHKTNDGVVPLQMSNLSLSLNCYLLDSGIQRTGKDMIRTFIDQWDQRKAKLTSLAKANDSAVNHVIGIQTEQLSTIVKKISLIQLEEMEYMILSDLKGYWHQGLMNDQFYIKVCGAGGGGYYLVFSKYKLENIGNYTLEKINL